MTRLRTAATAAVLLALVMAGCTEAQRAEIQGRDVGEALCDVRDADDQAEADDAAADVESELDDLVADDASFTAEDRADVRENLRDLVEHVVAGEEVLVQEDLAVLRANVEAIDETVDGATRAAASGIVQGLDDCT